MLMLVPAAIIACSEVGPTVTVSPQPANGLRAVPAGPFGKYDPPIELTAARKVDSNMKFRDGESIDNNIWTQTLENELGVKVKNIWVAVESQFEHKINVAIASNDLPDLFPVSSSQLQQLVEGGKVADLTGVFDKYASPLTRRILTEDGGGAMAAATFNGKLMAIPRTTSSIDGAQLLWVRTDWLHRLNLPEPKTMEDVFAISEAFAKRDPDGDGKDDTVGLLIEKNLWGGLPGLTGFFNAFHAYPGIWVKDGSGKIVYGGIQPEVKKALAKLQEMFKDGQIDREFGIKDWTKVSETIVSGKGGLFFGSMASPLTALQQLRNNDPNAEWKPYPIPSVDDRPARPRILFPVVDYYAVSSKARNPEAVVKMLNLYTERLWGETADPDTYQMKDGIEFFKYPPIHVGRARKNLDAHLHIIEVLKSGDVSTLNPEEKSYYDSIVKYNAGDQSSWGYNKVFGENGSFAVIDSYDRTDRYMPNAFYGPSTPTMVRKNAMLSKMEMELFTKIILGDAPVDEFDSFVAEWRKLGGDDMTREVNEAMASR
jgi:putative aldouronate transport system substrate-binding protein